MVRSWQEKLLRNKMTSSSPLRERCCFRAGINGIQFDRVRSWNVGIPSGDRGDELMWTIKFGLQYSHYAFVVIQQLNEAVECTTYAQSHHINEPTKHPPTC